MVILPPRSSLGDILGQGLEDIATSYAQHRTSLSALKGLGFNDAQARAYANLGPNIQAQAIQAKQQQESQERSSAIINSILNEGLGATGPQPYGRSQGLPQAEVPPTGMDRRAIPQAQQQAAIQQATGIAQNPAYRKLQEQQQGAQALQQQQLAQNFGPQANQPTAEQRAILQAQAQQGQREPSFKDRLEDIARRRRALAVAPLPNSTKIEAHRALQDQEKSIREAMKEARKDRESSREDALQANKDTKEVYQKTNDMAKGARDSDMRLDRIEQLIDKGNVQDNVLIRGLDRLSHNKYLGEIFGAIKTIIQNRDTEEFDKLSKDFLRDAKNFFGNRVTQQEVFTFLQTVPSLSQTNDGKRRVIRNLRIFNEGAKIRKKAMDDVIRENGGSRPQDLDSLIEEKAGAQLDKLADKFKSGPYGALGTIGHTAKEIATNLVTSGSGEKLNRYGI